MQHSFTAKPALAATATLAFLVSTAGAAPAGMPAGVARAVQQVAAPAVGPKKMQATYIGSGNGNGASLAQYSFTTVDAATVNCKNTTGCTIGLESMVQIQPNGGDWAICLYVDGVTTSCQYQGIQGSTSGWVVGNARGVSGTVAQGNHSVQTQVYVEGAGAIYAYYQTDYRVYKP